LFSIEAKGISAKGYENPEGFIVLHGSTAVCDEVSSIHRYLSDLRKELQSQGVLISRGDHLSSSRITSSTRLLLPQGSSRADPPMDVSTGKIIGVGL
jgi:hypothetical protein